jgi:transglutaminase/protease-like cytokinesis protein 3
VSIHLNAGRGDGVETFHSIYRGVGEDLATNIFNEIVKIGQNDDRGVKTKRGSDGSDYYYVIKYTNMPATIVECAFVDNVNDYKIVDTDAECKAMGYAIAKGIIKTLKEQGLYEDEELRYKSHVQKLGWGDWCKEGETCGTVGESKRMEALIIDAPAEWDLTCQVHVQNYGDMPVVADGEIAGTVGMSKRIEAIKIDANVDLMYRVHQQKEGWSKWYTNGQWAGIKGKSLRLEAIEIKRA